MMMPEELEEEEEEGGHQNRLFVILAVALIGLLVLGLVGIGGVFMVRQNMREQAAAARPTPTLLVRLPNPSATFTPTSLPTNTPAPTPTNTPVLAQGSGRGQEAASKKESDNNQALTAEATEAVPTPTRTPVVGAVPTGSTMVPETGIGGMGAALIGIGLAGVFFAARRLRAVL